MQKFECTLCGYIYDPALGDPDNGVEPNTAFEDVSEGASGEKIGFAHFAELEKKTSKFTKTN